MKKILFFIFSLFLILLAGLVYGCFLEEKELNETAKKLDSIALLKTDDSYQKMFNLMMSKMLVYNFKTTKDSDFYQMERNFARPIPKFLMDESDVFLGYGVSKDIDLEQNYALAFNKPSYAFDCGIRSIKNNTQKCTFVDECLGTDKYVKVELGQVSSKNVHTFDEKIKELKLENKKILVKLSYSIDGEYEVIEDVLKHSDKITGLIIAFQTENNTDLYKAIKMLEMLNKDFVLTTRIPSKLKKEEKEKFINYSSYEGQLNNDLFFLVFANKNLLDKYSISFIQNDKMMYRNLLKIESGKSKIKFKKIKNIEELNIYPGKVKFRIVFIQKIKEIFDFSNKK